MTKFLVKVVCAMHLSSCPIPNGYHGEYIAPSKTECEQKARMLIAGFGYKPRDFNVSCERP